MSWKWDKSLVAFAPAKLFVTPSDWGVEAYYFSADGRVKPAHLKIAGKDLIPYTEELIAAWNRYSSMRADFNDNVNLSIDGHFGIKIWVSGFPWKGVSAYGHYHLIKSKGQLADIVEELSSLEHSAHAIRSAIDGSLHNQTAPHRERLLKLIEK